MVYIGSTVYECMDGDLCSSLTPTEVFNEAVWRVVDGILTTTAEVEATEYVEALPLWMYSWYYEDFSLSSDTLVQWDDVVYQCCDP
jgi:hypothetical protein